MNSASLVTTQIATTTEERKDSKLMQLQSLGGGPDNEDSFDGFEIL